MFFTRFAKSSSSGIAMAAALAVVGVLGVTAIEQPAAAQKKDKKQKEAKQNYSKGFVAAYQPIAEQAQGETANWSALAGQVPALVQTIETEDDRFAAGQFIYQVGSKNQDAAMQLQGAELMLASGKVPAESQSQYNLLAGQLSYNAKDYGKARTYLSKAAELGAADAQGLIAETYFNDNQHAEGLTYLKQAIEAKQAAGETVEEDWIRRGLSIAYNNKLQPQIADFGLMYVRNYPNATNWGEIIAINAYGGGYANPEILDFMRLARETDGMRDEKMYADYIDAADYRRLPGEVVAVIDEGYAAGKLTQDGYAAEIRGMAAERATADKADLAGIISGAQSASDGQKILTGADVALSYGDNAAAELLYTKALNASGVDKNLVLTRLGIAQLEQGKAAEAKASFAQVQGKRKALADLWTAYADQSAS